MKAFFASTLIVGFIASANVFAAAPTDAPAGSMGMCSDGTYSSSAEKKGACRGHKGVKDWYGAAAAEKGNVTTSTMNTPAASPTTTTTKTAPGSKSPATTAMAPGGGAGQVWGNESTKVYHCNGDKWYGKTKHGAYMSESDAKSKGYRADHGKACS